MIETYVHPHCVRCKEPKDRNDSHCPTQTCPWCRRCWKTLAKETR